MFGPFFKATFEAHAIAILGGQGGSERHPAHR
jgi:hypothetical protein